MTNIVEPIGVMDFEISSNYDFTIRILLIESERLSILSFAKLGILDIEF